jgi:hypothetical protein
MVSSIRTAHPIHASALCTCAPLQLPIGTASLLMSVHDSTPPEHAPSAMPESTLLLWLPLPCSSTCVVGILQQRVRSLTLLALSTSFDRASLGEGRSISWGTSMRREPARWVNFRGLDFHYRVTPAPAIFPQGYQWQPASLAPLRRTPNPPELRLKRL